MKVTDEMARAALSMYWLRAADPGDEPEYSNVDLDEMRAAIEAAIKAAPVEQAEQQPVAWRTFDGEGGYDYRSYEDNEDYAEQWRGRNPKPTYADWVQPLYLHPPQPDALRGGRGEMDAWLEVMSEAEVREHIRQYAESCYRAGQRDMRKRVCAVVYGQCESDNVAQRTVDAIRALPIDGGDA